jgi:hypothetical protein
MSKSNNKKLNFKEKLTDDNLDLSLCSLETVPVKEIVLKSFKLVSALFIIHILYDIK